VSANSIFINPYFISYVEIKYHSLDICGMHILNFVKFANLRLKQMIFAGMSKTVQNLFWIFKFH